MLRLTVLLLLLANGVFFAWSQGLLLPWGIGPAQQAEPQRLRQQIRPELVRILPPDELRRLEQQVTQGPRPAECLASAALDEAQLGPLRTALEGWPSGSWSLETVSEPPRWILYMGKYAGVEQVARKRAELRQLGISFEPPASPELEPGLSLGSFSSEQAAQQQLQSLADRGVRTARVLQDHPEQRGQRLLLAVVDDTLRTRLEQLRPLLGNRTLRPCR